MAEIIKIEAPISKSLLFRKVMKLWNTARAGNKLNNYLSEIADSLSSSFKTQAWQEFYWNATNQPDSISSYRDNSIEKRSIEDIAPEEISVAIMEIMEVNLSLEKEDLIRLVARAFGFQKVGAQIEAVINQVLGKMLNENLLSETDNRFKMNRFYL